jgi:hypothetical protein
MPICRMFSTGATGLEPATSGVTGRRSSRGCLHRQDAGRRDACPLPGAEKRDVLSASFGLTGTAGSASGALAAEDGPYRRRPPLRTAMGGRRLARVEVAGDLMQALPLPVLCLNVTHELVRDGGRPSRRRRRLAHSRGAAPLFDESLELVDRNQSGTPGHVDRFEQGEHPPAEGRSTQPEGLCGLRPRVGEPLDLRCLPNMAYGELRSRAPGGRAALRSCPPSASDAGPSRTDRTQTLSGLHR